MVILAAIGILVIATLITIPALIYEGFVFSKLWAWLILPIFPGLPPLTFIWAMGLVFFARYLIPHKHKVDEKKPWLGLVILVTAPTLALGIGWLIHLFY